MIYVCRDVGNSFPGLATEEYLKFFQLRGFSDAVPLSRREIGSTYAIQRSAVETPSFASK